MLLHARPAGKQETQGLPWVVTVVRSRLPCHFFAALMYFSGLALNSSRQPVQQQ